MSKRDPLAAIPDAEAVRHRLQLVLEEARKLKIVLRTAEEIEREGENAKAGRQPQGVVDAK